MVLIFPITVLSASPAEDPEPPFPPKPKPNDPAPPLDSVALRFPLIFKAPLPPPPPTL